jgi:hypothetical protein
MEWWDYQNVDGGHRISADHTLKNRNHAILTEPSEVAWVVQKPNWRLNFDDVGIFSPSVRTKEGSDLTIKSACTSLFPPLIENFKLRRQQGKGNRILNVRCALNLSPVWDFA